MSTQRTRDQCLDLCVCAFDLIDRGKRSRPVSADKRGGVMSAGVAATRDIHVHEADFRHFDQGLRLDAHTYVGRSEVRYLRYQPRDRPTQSEKASHEAPRSINSSTRRSARLNETCIETLWVGLSLWVGTSDLPTIRKERRKEKRVPSTRPLGPYCNRTKQTYLDEKV